MQIRDKIVRIGALLARFRAWLRRFDAPVLIQEMRVRQRGIKPFAVMFVYLLILSTVAILGLIFFPRSSGPSTVHDMAEVGRQMYVTISAVQLLMLVLIVPAYSSASVSGERERGTFDLLALTVLSSMAIVTQKLAAAIAQSLMLIVASLPILAIVFLLGGVSPGEVLVAYGLLIATAILLGALGLLCSCCLRNSKASTFATYLIVFSCYAGVPIGCAWFQGISHSGMNSLEGPFAFLVFALIFLFVGGVGAVLVYAPLSLILHRRTFWRTRAFRMAVFGGVYAILLLVVTCPAATTAVFNASSFNDVPLPLFVNPFVALFMFMDAHYGGSALPMAYWMIAATIAFSLGGAYLFRHISSARFADLRSRT